MTSPNNTEITNQQQEADEQPQWQNQMEEFTKTFPSLLFPTEWLNAQNQAFYSLYPRTETDPITGQTLSTQQPFPHDAFILSEHAKIWPLWDALDAEERTTEWRKRRDRCMVWLASSEKNLMKKDVLAKEKRAIRSVEKNRARMEKKLMTDEEKSAKKEEYKKLNGNVANGTENSKKRKRNDKSSDSAENPSKKKRKNNKQNGHAAAPASDDESIELNGNAGVSSDDEREYDLNRFRPEDMTEKFSNKRNKLSIKQKLSMVRQMQENPKAKEEMAIHAAVMKAEGKRDKLNPKVLKNQLKQMKHKKKKTKEQWEKRVQDEETTMKNAKQMKDLNRQLKRVRGRPGFEGGRHVLNSVANIKKILKGNTKGGKGKRGGGKRSK